MRIRESDPQTAYVGGSKDGYGLVQAPEQTVMFCISSQFATERWLGIRRRTLQSSIARCKNGAEMYLGYSASQDGIMRGLFLADQNTGERTSVQGEMVSEIGKKATNGVMSLAVLLRTGPSHRAPRVSNSHSLIRL